MDTTVIERLVGFATFWLEESAEDPTVRRILEVTTMSVQALKLQITQIELMAARGQLIRQFSRFIPA